MIAYISPPVKSVASATSATPVPATVVDCTKKGDTVAEVRKFFFGRKMLALTRPLELVPVHAFHRMVDDILKDVIAALQTRSPSCMYEQSFPFCDGAFSVVLLRGTVMTGDAGASGLAVHVKAHEAHPLMTDELAVQDFHRYHLPTGGKYEG